MIVTRPATPQDVPRMVALDQEVFGAYGADEDPAIIAARVAVFPAGCVVLEQPAEPGVSPALVGYLTTEKWTTVREPALDEDPYLTHDPTGTVLCITTLVVAPAFQNQGWGKHLLDCAVATAYQEGCKQIVLETAHARAFYLRHGFEVVGERTERGITLYIMRRVLSSEAPIKSEA